MNRTVRISQVALSVDREQIEVVSLALFEFTECVLSSRTNAEDRWICEKSFKTRTGECFFFDGVYRDFCYPTVVRCDDWRLKEANRIGASVRRKERRNGCLC